MSKNKNEQTNLDFPRPNIATNRRNLIGGSAALAAAGVLAAPQYSVGAQEPSSGGTLIIAYNADPEILDPHRTTALIAGRAFAITNEQLVTRDYDGEFAPGLAESWDISEDGLTYTFTLREGVTFHSGKEMTSEDVKYTFDRWRNMEASPTAYLIEAIENVEAPDPLTVVFTMTEPYNIFLDQLAGAYGVILNGDVVEEAGEQYGVSVVDGTGPFRFVSWERNDRLVFERFDDYTWAAPIFDNPGPAYLDGIEIRIYPEDATRVAEFQSGNVHIVQNVPSADVERLSDSDGIDILQYDELETTFMGMNLSKFPTDDVNVRQAVNYAINREEIVEGAYFGLATPAYTHLHPSTPGFWEGALDAAPTYDPDHARSLLEEAGWTEGDDGIRVKDGEELVIPLWVINNSEAILTSQILEQQLGAVGIRIDTIQYEESAWFEATRGGEQVGFTIGVRYENADNLFFYFHSDQQPAPNRFSFDDPEVDAWLVETRSNPDQEAVQEAYDNVQRRLSEVALNAPLKHQHGTLGKADSAHGVRVHPSRWLYRMIDIWLEN